MKKLPYEDLEEIQAILNSDKTIDEKANEIRSIIYKIESLGTDGRLPPIMTVNQIRDNLIERER